MPVQFQQIWRDQGKRTESRDLVAPIYGWVTEFPAEHWKHLRTSNVIESPFATVRLRQRVTKGAGSRTKGLPMAYKLLAMAQARWRRLNGPSGAPWSSTPRPL